MDQPDQKLEKVSKHKKWVPRPLVTVCGVCGSPATDVHHYGATSCYSCRAFFRRSIGSGKDYRYCSRKTDACVVDAVSRTNCKKCRFQKCLKVGMKPEKVDRVRKKAKFIKTEIKEEITDNDHNSEEFFIRRSISESSQDSSNSVDISALAEECIFEEVKFPDDSLPITLDEADLNTSFKCEEETYIDESEFYDIRTQPTIVRSSPIFHLTFEEDFKIHELLVRKENLVDGIFQTIMEQPEFLKCWKQFLVSVNCGTSSVYKGFGSQEVVGLVRQYTISNFLNGGVIRQSLDMFDEYKNVEESVKTETFFFSMTVFHLCIRAILIANKHKDTFVNQHRAAGTFTNSFQKACSDVFPDTIHAISSFDPRNVSLFTSPWAARLEDEEFFSHTLDTVGNIIKDDIKLGTLYCTLILATPGLHLSKAARCDPSLHRVQREMTILIYRYLSHKLGNSHYASTTTSALTKLLADLHICREIHLFGRLNCLAKGTLEVKIEDLEI